MKSRAGSIKRKLKAVYFNLKIREKLMIMTLLLFIVWVVLFGYMFYRKSTLIIKDQTAQSLMQALEQKEQRLRYRLNEISRLSYSLFANEELQRILLRYHDMETGNEIEDYRLLSKLLVNSQYSYKVKNIKIYLSNQTIFTNEGINLSYEGLLKDKPYYKNIIENNGWIFWLEPETYNSGEGMHASPIKLLRILKFTKNYVNRKIGILEISISLDEINSILGNDKNYKETVCLINNTGRILYDPDKSLIGETIDISGFNGRDGMFITGRGKKERILLYRTLHGFDWKIVNYIPTDQILSQAVIIRDYYLGLFSVALIMSVLLITFYASSISKRIRVILDEMKKVESKDFNTSIDVLYNDEIGEIESGLNRMMNELDRLVNQVYHNEIKKKEAELRALQAQINPHFLYNTLDVITWVSYEHNCTPIAKIVSTLGKFFRLSLNKGRDVVALKDEVEHAIAYVQLQKYRFGDSFDFTINIPEDIYAHKIPKLTLQPFIENSIIHGIQKRKNIRGEISIVSERAGDDIKLVIRDNGAGSSIKSDKELMACADRKQDGGYGIKNVVDRLKLYFGEKYGVSFHSEEGVGTTVEILIPGVENEKAE